MNILILDNSIGITGALKAIIDTVEPLKEKHNFIFVLQNESTVTEYVKSKGFKTYNLQFTEVSKSVTKNIFYPFQLVYNSIKLYQIAKKESINIIEVNDLYNLTGNLTKLFLNVKLITHVRRMPESFPLFIYKIWCAIHVKQSDLILPVSNANARIFHEHKKVVVLYDPIVKETKKFEYTIQTKKKLTILYLANYTRGKGQNNLIDFISEYIKEYNSTNFCVKFVGFDFDLKNNQNYKEELTTQIKDLKLDDFFIVGNGAKNIYNEIKEADIMLNLSDSESLSRVTMEALYFGIPIIATNVGGTNEMIEDNVNGYLIEKGDVKDFNKKLNDLINNEMTRKSMSEKKNLVEIKFNSEKISKKLEELYLNL